MEAQPNKPDDQRFLGELGEIKTTYKNGYRVDKKLEATVERRWKDIILTTSNLGHIQIHTIIPLIGIIPLVFLIHSLQSIIPTARLSLRALKEGFI